MPVRSPVRSNIRSNVAHGSRRFDGGVPALRRRQPGASRAVCAHAAPTWCCRRRALIVRAGKDGKDDALSGVVKSVSGMVDKATDMVPESVPRPAAKAGVALAGVMVVFWVVSGVVTLALFAGVGYYLLTQQGKDSDDAIDVPPPSKRGGSKGKGGDDLDDPLAEARKIMDKYK
ncbi:hypothetical protein TSOC_004892 [Tetrabaena socialis]|uniref:Uncharacterized protein n=1 Tax=Tetrabaena socialis TaxID=47790 RepID=A0A2J8A7R3_9CHLO|nr:hypothetical protein TSOC_004892 [Tetrabaena socialis]|eukprot:PNH08545.1 hypothetical protein TSOC_004892 [Tetrabaena socialis]